MSLILDALNKSEREKNNKPDAVPDLQTVHGALGAEQIPPAPRLWWLIAGTVFVLVLVIALVMWLVSERRGVEVSSTQAQMQDQKQAELAEEKAPENSAEEPPAQQVEPQISKAVNTIKKAEQQNLSEQQQPVSPDSRALETKQAKPEATPATVPTSPSSEISALYESAREASPASEQEEPLRVVKPTTTSQNTVDEALAQRLWEQAQEDMAPKPLPSARDLRPEPSKASAAAQPELDAPFEDTLAAFADTPFLHELSPRIHDRVPTLDYAVHRFADGMVIINKKRYQEGDQVAQGVILERLLADGLILDFEGHQFKLGALSSWVNY